LQGFSASWIVDEEPDLLPEWCGGVKDSERRAPNL
jgi:hypothetical protein